MPNTPNYDSANANAEAIIKSRIASGQFPNAQQLEQIRETELNLAAIEFINKNPGLAQELANSDARIKAAIEKTNPPKAPSEEERVPSSLESLTVETTPVIPPTPPSPIAERRLESETKNSKPNTKTHKIMIGAIMVLVIIAAISGFFYMKSQNQLNMLKNNPDEISKQATGEILDKVRKLLILPTDEEPTIATVTDLEKLKDQPFFAKAQIGDKVLIYTNNKKAIIYRPDTNQIVDVAPIDNQSSGAQTASPTPTPLPSPSPTPAPKATATPKPQATSSANLTN